MGGTIAYGKSFEKLEYIGNDGLGRVDNHASRIIVAAKCRNAI